MRSVKVVIAVLAAAVLPLAQEGGKSEREAPPVAPQTRILELPLAREGAPMVLFDLAEADEKGRCRVHHVPLEEALVPVAYGLMPGPGPKYFKTRKRNFPNAHTRYEAGCLVTGAREAKVLQCRKCLKAMAEYERKKRAA
jgi:hypothetical protein